MEAFIDPGIFDGKRRQYRCTEGDCIGLLLVVVAGNRPALSIRGEIDQTAQLIGTE
jgi:hypothetical protein